MAKKEMSLQERLMKGGSTGLLVAGGIFGMGILLNAIGQGSLLGVTLNLANIPGIAVTSVGAGTLATFIS